MTVYALFHDGTAKDVRIILNRNDKNFLEVGQIGVIKDSIFASARNAIQQSWPLLLKNQLLEENKRYLLVTPLGLGKEADGESAGLAFAAAFICKLSEEGFINSSLKISGNVAATGIIDDTGDVQPVTHIQEKAFAAMERGCNCMFIPRKNETELIEAPGMAERIQSAKMKLIPVDSVQDLLMELIGSLTTSDQPGLGTKIKQFESDEIHIKKLQGKHKTALILLSAFAVLLAVGIFLIKSYFSGLGNVPSQRYDDVFENKTVSEGNSPTPLKYTETTKEIIPSSVIVTATNSNKLPENIPTISLSKTIPTANSAATPMSIAAPAPPKPTSIAAPTPTGSSNVIVRAYNEYRSSKSSAISLHYKIINNGNTSIDLKDLKLRYYFTNDGVTLLNCVTDYTSNCDAEKVIYSFQSTSGYNADTYLSIGFANDTGVIEPGSKVAIVSRIHDGNEKQMFNQTNDYSFDGTSGTYVDANRMTLWSQGTKIWGLEPF